jgi:hypothetical protein
MDTIILSIAGLFALTILVGIRGNMKLSNIRGGTRHTGGKTKRQTIKNRSKKIIV